MTKKSSLFIQLAIKKGVLKFGQFKTKAGRLSPYFFNLGNFNDGASLGQLGEFYAGKIRESELEFDMLYGPAYKGIPLVASIAIALSDETNPAPYSFNRKEEKDHGEGGQMIGSPINGKVLIVDDVISAGTSIKESIDIIKKHGGVPSGIVVAIDRQEKGDHEKSALQGIQEKYKIPVISIISLNEIIDYVKDDQDFKAILDDLKSYQNQYGAS